MSKRHDVKHEACGAEFTVSPDSFAELFKVNEAWSYCPVCSAVLYFKVKRRLDGEIVKILINPEEENHESN